MSALEFSGTLCVISSYTKSIHCIPYKTAQSTLEKQIGMMNALSMNYALTFPYNDSDYRSFWMKNVLFPLDIVFIQQGVIIDIVHRAPPCVTDERLTEYNSQSICPSYSSSSPADMVVEFPGGWCHKRNIQPGDMIKTVY